MALPPKMNEEKGTRLDSLFLKGNIDTDNNYFLECGSCGCFHVKSCLNKSSLKMLSSRPTIRETVEQRRKEYKDGSS